MALARAPIPEDQTEAWRSVRPSVLYSDGSVGTESLAV